MIIIQKHLEVCGSNVCNDIPAVNNDGNIVEFNGANAADQFNFKTKITGQMPLINCEVNLILTWSENCVIPYTDVAIQNSTLAITETTLCVPVVTLSTQDKANLLQPLKIRF